LRRDLDEIQHLITALRSVPLAQPDELEDLTWLQGRRRYVLAVLAGRKSLQRRKIVNLEQWRSGGVTLPEAALGAA
jgi:hypothetical protein